MSMNEKKFRWNAGYDDGVNARPIQSDDPEYLKGHAKGLRDRQRMLDSASW